MGLARSLEKRLERLVDGLSATIFRGRMQPVDMANRLVRQADLMIEEGPAGPTIPNVFDVAVSQDDLAPELDTTLLTTELSNALTQTAADRGWRIGGPIAVRLRVDLHVGRGSIRCAARPVPAELPAWGELTEHRGSRSYPLRDNRVLIGRSSESDAVVDEPEISRLHAVLFRQGGRYWVSDLGSANGTTVNGYTVEAEPVELGPGDMLSFGPTTFALRTG